MGRAADGASGAKASDSREVTEDEINNHLMRFAETGAISKYAVPRRVDIVQVIEKTSVGKVNKKLLREKYAAT